MKGNITLCTNAYWKEHEMISYDRVPYGITYQKNSIVQYSIVKFQYKKLDYRRTRGMIFMILCNAI